VSSHCHSTPSSLSLADGAKMLKDGTAARTLQMRGDENGAVSTAPHTSGLYGERDSQAADRALFVLTGCTLRISFS
jgi:hypothetical protein